MKEKRVKEIVIVGDKYSAQGYFYIAIKDSHLIDVLQVKCNKHNWAIAEAVIIMLELNGWQRNEEGIRKEPKKRVRCTKCFKIFDGTSEKCPECKSLCKDASLINQVVTLEKIGALRALQEEVMAKKENKDIFMFIETNKYRQTINDAIILSRWE